jgi:hypothetical protein
MSLGHVGFVKIDVEGHELDVLTGLSGLLAKCLPNLLIEISGVQRGGGARRKFAAASTHWAILVSGLMIEAC